MGGGHAVQGNHEMEAIVNHLNLLHKFFKDQEKIRITQNKQNQWLLEDNEYDIAACVVIRYMIQNNYKNIGCVYLLQEPEKRAYTLHFCSEAEEEIEAAGVPAL